MYKIRIFSLITCLCLLFSLPLIVSAETITLSLSDQNSDVGWGPVHATQPWAKQVEEATQGRLKIQIYPNQTLAKGKQNWNAAKRGIADLSWNVMTYYSGMTPYADVITLPGLPFKTAEKGAEVLWKLYEKFPAMSKQFDENKVLILYPSDPFILLMAKKEVKNLEDVKGLKLRTVGGTMVQAMKAYGANPMFMPMPDCYIAMQKGTVDGMGGTWEAMTAFRLHEVTKYVTDNVPLGVSYFAVVMNKKKWAGLPKDIQDAIMSVSGLKGSKFFGRNFFDSARAAVPKIAKETGYNVAVYPLPEQENQKWVDIGGKPIWKGWVKRMESKGYKEAQAILDAAIEMSK
jgi:TRAP-type C4-dicarboxylate transport system substrate-binding protein